MAPFHLIKYFFIVPIPRNYLHFASLTCGGVLALSENDILDGNLVGKRQK